jgi:hypothetical protein
LELGKNQRRAETLPWPALPEKEADGAGFSLNLPQLRVGNRIGDVQDGSSEDRLRNRREQAGLSIL